MADDRMKNDDLNRKMGGQGSHSQSGKEGFGQQMPGRNPKDSQSGQRTGGGLGNDAELEDDDELNSGRGGSTQGGRQGNQSGQENMGQKR